MRAVSLAFVAVFVPVIVGCGTTRGGKPQPPPRPLASPEQQERAARELAAQLRGGLQAANIHSVALVSNVTPAQAATMNAWVERVRLELAADPALTVVSPLRAAPAVVSLGRALPIDASDAAFMAQLAEALKVEGVVVIRPDPQESLSRLGAVLSNAAGQPQGSWNATFELDLLEEVKSDAKRQAAEELDLNKKNSCASSCCSCGIGGCMDACLGLFCRSKS
jgi:hypothetical protein